MLWVSGHKIDTIHTSKSLGVSVPTPSKLVPCMLHYLFCSTSSHDMTASKGAGMPVPPCSLMPCTLQSFFCTLIGSQAGDTASTCLPGGGMQSCIVKGFCLLMYACNTSLVLKPRSPRVWAAEKECKAYCCNQSLYCGRALNSCACT